MSIDTVDGKPKTKSTFMAFGEEEACRFGAQEVSLSLAPPHIKEMLKRLRGQVEVKG